MKELDTKSKDGKEVSKIWGNLGSIQISHYFN